MGKWSNLTPQQKAAVIKFAIDNGVSDINKIRDTFNVYAIDNGVENEYKEGGSIHIKHPGKLTALKKRTGKTEAELWAEGKADVRKMITFARNARKWKHDDGGDMNIPAVQSILKNRNSLDRKYDFIADTWDSEYTVKKGYDQETGLYFPYDSPEGGTKTVGPGLKLRKDGLEDDRTPSLEKANQGLTRERINKFLGNHADYQYQKVLEYLNQKGNRLPYDTISPSIMRGLMDLRYQVGSLGNFNNLREAVLNGDLTGIKQESKVYYRTPSGRRKEDIRRNDHREGEFWNYSTGGPLYPFSFSGHIPAVRYDEGGEFLPNETIQNVPLWLNKGTKFQKQRPVTVNIQNITSSLDPSGPDNQYIWDDDSHTSYSAFKRNSNYRAPVVPSVQIGPQALQTVPADASKIAITARLPKPKPLPMSSLPLGLSRTTAQQNWIQTDVEYNPAFGYDVYHLENTPKYGIKYYSIPGAANAGEGHYAVLDSAAMGIPIQELNRRIYDYRTNHGGWNSFNPVD